MFYRREEKEKTREKALKSLEKLGGTIEYEKKPGVSFFLKKEKIMFLGASP
jgi:hypothetical protein